MKSLGMRPATTRAMKIPRALVSLICLPLCLDVPNTHAQTAAEYVNRGLAQQKAGDLDAAIAAYDRAITFNPQVNPARMPSAISPPRSD